MSLERNLTHLAVVEYLESQPPLVPIAANLDDTVDGNVLIEAVKLWKSANPLAIKPYFKEDSPIGALGALAQRLHLFVVTEAQVEKEQHKQKKYDLSEEKRAKLLKRIAEERKSAVGPEALKLSVEALAASAEAAVHTKAEKKRAVFEKEGAVFNMKINLEGTQSHFKYYLENQAVCLGLIDGTVLSSERVLDKKGKKKKAGDSLRTKLVLQEKIKVPPHFMSKIFAERDEDGEDLMLNAVEGPFSQPYFVGIFCAHRNTEQKETTIKAAKVKPEKLKEERDEAVAKATARGSKLIAAAHRVLLARLSDNESLAAEATEVERARVEQAVVQARIVKKAEEDRSLAAIDAEEKKWAALIEVSEAAHAKVEALAASAKAGQEKALKRKSDLTSQAERRVQQETIANAAKRGTRAELADADEPRLEEVPTDIAEAALNVQVAVEVDPAAAALTPVEETAAGRADIVARVAATEADVPAAAMEAATPAAAEEAAAPAAAEEVAPAPVAVADLF